MSGPYEIYNLLPTCIAVLNQNGDFIFRNSLWENTFSNLSGHSSLKEMLSSFDGIPSDQLTPFISDLEQVLEADHMEIEKLFLAVASGKQQWFKLEVKAIDEGAVVMITSLIEEMPLNLELGEQAEIRGMLHDIKSPLSIMTSLSYLLRKENGDQLTIKSHEYLEAVSHTANEISFKLNLLSQHVRDQDYLKHKQ